MTAPVRVGPVGVGLVGYGMAASSLHAPLIAAEPALALRAVVSRDPAKVPATGVPTVALWRNHTSQLLDPSPATGWEDVDLAVGTSWTTPEGTTITTTAVTADSATVTIGR